MYNNGYHFGGLESHMAQRMGGQMPPSGGRPNQQPSWGAPPNQPGRAMPVPGGGSNQSPMGPPPSFTPAAPMTQAYTGGMSMNRCLFRNTYVWMRNGRSFWFFPTAITRNMIFGFRWSNRSGWVPRSIQQNHIMTFTCSFF